MAYTPHWNVVWAARWDLLSAARTTLEITALSMIVGTVLGALLALARHSGPPPLRRFATAWVELARNTPALFQIYMAYFGLGAFGIHLDAWTAVTAALSFNNAGYMTEILRGGLVAVPRTQYAAARSLGMRAFQAYLHVVMPQVVRIVWYPTTNQVMWAMLNTSLGMTVGLRELAGETAFQQSRTFRAFEFFTAAAAIYYVLAKVLLFGGRALQRLAVRE